MDVGKGLDEIWLYNDSNFKSWEVGCSAPPVSLIS